MTRLNVNITRKESFKKQNFGKAIFFCEGETEYNYFNHFAKIFNKKSSKYSQIHIELECAEGNAQTVLNCADDFYKDEVRRREYMYFEPYLVFDCDDPNNIQEVVLKMNASKNDYNLALTNPLFELWLLMHYEEVYKRISKKRIIEKLTKRLNYIDYSSKDKAKEGTIRKIVENGNPVLKAINNAKKLESKYGNKFNINNDITKMDPYTTVHKVVESIMIEIND